MNNTSAVNTSLKNTSGPSMIIPSRAEGIAWCSAFILTAFFIVVGNLLTIALFVVNKRLRKKSLFLVVNMAFADLMLGTLSLPIYIYDTGAYFELWTWGTSSNESLSFFFILVDTIFIDASLIFAVFISGERIYAVFWPFKHRTLSMRAYRIVMTTAWALVLIDTAVYMGLERYVSIQFASYEWMAFFLVLTLIMFGCNIGIWRKFQQESVASLQQNRAWQNKRLTKILLLVSFLAFLSWFPLNIAHFLFFGYNVRIPSRFYDLLTIFSYSNSFINPILYAYRLPEFRRALALCCLRRQVAMKMGGNKCKNINAYATLATQLRTLRTRPSQLNPAFEEEVLDTNI